MPREPRTRKAVNAIDEEQALFGAMDPDAMETAAFIDGELQRLSRTVLKQYDILLKHGKPMERIAVGKVVLSLYDVSARAKAARKLKLQVEEEEAAAKATAEAEAKALREAAEDAAEVETVGEDGVDMSVLDEV